MRSASFSQTNLANLEIRSCSNNRKRFLLVGRSYSMSPLEGLEMYDDSDPGIYDPHPPAHVLTLAQYAMCARFDCDDDAFHSRDRSRKAWSDCGVVRVSTEALSQVCHKRKAAGLSTCRKFVDTVGAPSRARTCDLLIRSQTLYPTELRVHGTDGKARPQFTTPVMGYLP